MKKIIIKTFAFALFILLCMSSKIKAFIDEPGLSGGGSNNIVTLQVNEPYTITYGNSKSFQISLNSTERYYVVETWGSADTKLTISGGIYQNGYITDLNSGVDSNAHIEILSTGTYNSPSTTYISLSLETNSQVKETTLIVREETASIYAFNYGKNDADTTSIVDYPYDALNTNYNASKYLNKTSTHVAENDVRNMPRYDSEILLIFGHGLESLGAGGQGMVFLEDSCLGAIDYFDITTPNTKFAFFGGCKTANPNATMNISSVAVDYGGAKCSLGFVESISIFFATLS